MTHDIDKMPAGPELDRLACESLGIAPEIGYAIFSEFTQCKIWPTFRFGVADKDRAEETARWMRERGDHGKLSVREVQYLPSISTDPQVATKAMGQVRGMTLRYGHDKDGEWTAKARVPGFAYEKYVDASADTAALAIARAIALWGAKP